MSHEGTGDEVASLKRWVERLEDLIDDIRRDSSETPIELCEHAMDTWSEYISPATAPSPGSAAASIVVETMTALAESTSIVVLDDINTPDARDRITHDSALETMESKLEKIFQDGQDWLADGAPSASEIQSRIDVARQTFEKINEVNQEHLAQQESEDAEATADPFGAILGFANPEIDAAIAFTKVCSFSAEEDERYRAAYERLRRMIDSELLRHISDENERICDVLTGTINDIVNRRISLNDQDEFDERRRRLRSALISFTSALNSHKDQSIRAARSQFGRKTPQDAQVGKLFDDLLATSFDYRWLMKMRDALLHGDINAFKIRLHASLNGDSEADVLMDREYMLNFTKETREKWLKRNELENCESDPSVLRMIKNIQPLIIELQEKLDEILYPNVADDAATVVELIGRFEGRNGMYALQSGPGFTRRLKIPPYNFLAPRVLFFAENYGTSTPSE